MPCSQVQTPHCVEQEDKVLQSICQLLLFLSVMKHAREFSPVSHCGLKDMA